jgi:hypothetical protein
MGRKEFKYYFSIQLSVLSKVDLSHSTFADLLNNFVVTDYCTNHKTLSNIEKLLLIGTRKWNWGSKLAGSKRENLPSKSRMLALSGMVP